MTTEHVQIDDSDLMQACVRLPGLCTNSSARAALDVATDRAQRLRHALPKRSGRLASSVLVDRDTDSAAISFGAGVPYAGWIDHGGGHGREYVSGGRYTGPSLDGAERDFQQATERLISREVAQL